MEIETHPTSSSTKFSTPYCAPAVDRKVSGKLCEARKSLACQDRDGQLEPDRMIRKNTRYCRECGPLVRLEQNAQRKRELRRQRGWRQYRDEYSPFLSEAERKAEHRAYMRAWRAWRRYQTTLSFVVSKHEERVQRGDFIKMLRGNGNAESVPSGFAVRTIEGGTNR